MRMEASDSTRREAWRSHCGCMQSSLPHTTFHKPQTLNCAGYCSGLPNSGPCIYNFITPAHFRLDCHPCPSSRSPAVQGSGNLDDVYKRITEHIPSHDLVRLWETGGLAFLWLLLELLNEGYCGRT